MRLGSRERASFKLIGTESIIRQHMFGIQRATTGEKFAVEDCSFSHYGLFIKRRSPNRPDQSGVVA
jgi:hypothetical protein